jgi:beta-lactamase superfamily II metal-dependent hydrolase
MFKVKFLPARFGDSIWIEYGDEHAPRRLLIDGGTAGTRKNLQALLNSLPVEQRRFELIVVTHIDRDHIEGILGLLEQVDLDFEVGEVWFNGWLHLPSVPGAVSYGAIQGERLSESILDHQLPWNRLFNEQAVSLPESGDLPVIELPGGMKLTLLSPTLEKLAQLKPVWEREVRDANLEPGFGMAENDANQPVGEVQEYGIFDFPDIDLLAASKFEEDNSEANGSSIAFLAEYDGKRVALTADAHADALLEAFERLSPANRINLDLYKLSHHGSKFTTSRPLIEKLDCPLYVFSTNGSIFKHPDQETVSRVIVAGGEHPELVFNYRNDRNDIWDLESLKSEHGYTTRYPTEPGQGIEISL